MIKRKEDGMEKVREYCLRYSGKVSESYGLLGRYFPKSMVKWIELKESLFEEPPLGALSLREKELICVAIEIATHKPNVDLHVRKAMEAGATVRQIAEVAGHCILLGGMMTYVESGQYALKFAEEFSDSGKKTTK